MKIIIEIKNENEISSCKKESIKTRTIYKGSYNRIFLDRKEHAGEQLKAVEIDSRAYDLILFCLETGIIRNQTAFKKVVDTAIDHIKQMDNIDQILRFETDENLA